MHDALTNRYLQLMMPNASPEQEGWQRAFFATKTEDELRQIINDCYDLNKMWVKKKNKYK